MGGGGGCGDDSFDDFGARCQFVCKGVVWLQYKREGVSVSSDRIRSGAYVAILVEDHSVWDLRRQALRKS